MTATPAPMRVAEIALARNPVRVLAVPALLVVVGARPGWPGARGRGPGDRSGHGRPRRDRGGRWRGAGGPRHDRPAVRGSRLPAPQGDWHGSPLSPCPGPAVPARDHRPAACEAGRRAPRNPSSHQPHGAPRRRTDRGHSVRGRRRRWFWCPPSGGGWRLLPSPRASWWRRSWSPPIPGPCVPRLPRRLRPPRPPRRLLRPFPSRPRSPPPWPRPRRPPQP